MRTPCCKSFKTTEARLACIEAKLGEIVGILETIQADTKRNSDVASKYGAKADAVLGVVDTAKGVLSLATFGVLGPAPSSPLALTMEVDMDEKSMET